MDTDYIRELFSEFGSIHIRRMFGGAGLYADDVMFGLVSDGQIYLKADTNTAVNFQNEDCGRFTYETRNGKRALLSYWRLPDRLYDDPAGLAQWAKLALGAARRSAASRPAKTVRKRPAKTRR